MPDHQLNFCSRKISRIKRGTHKLVKFCSFKHYLADHQPLTGINFPNYQNFNNTTEVYDDFIQNIMIAIAQGSKQLYLQLPGALSNFNPKVKKLYLIIFFYVFQKNYTLTTFYISGMKPDLTYYHNFSFPLNIFLFFPEKKTLVNLWTLSLKNIKIIFFWKRIFCISGFMPIKSKIDFRNLERLLI